MAQRRTRIRVLVAAFLALFLAQWTPSDAGADAGEAMNAEAVLDRARSAYAAAGPFHETLEFEIVMPDGKHGTRRQDYGVGSQGGAFFRLEADGQEGIRIVAVDGRVVALWAHIAGRYAETGYEGDFVAAMSALEASQVQLWAPPAIVAAQGGDSAAFLEALRFGILQPVESISVKESEGGGAEGVVEVEFRAANGSAVVGIDAASGRFVTVSFALGEGESQVRATGAFEFAAGQPVGELALPEVEGLISVSTITALEASKYPLGDPAPAIIVPALDGESVDLGGLAGQVVVLDFWATWCVPCWAALEHTEALTRWAKDSDLPVRVFAVNSLESTEDLETKRDKIRNFLATKDLELDVLVDHGDKAFAAFHNPGLPSLVIVDREGRLVEYHSGVLDDMTEVIKSRILELVE